MLYMYSIFDSIYMFRKKYFENIVDLEDRALFLESIKPFQSFQSTMYQIRRRNISPAPSVQGQLFII